MWYNTYRIKTDYWLGKEYNMGTEGYMKKNAPVSGIIKDNDWSEFSLTPQTEQALEERMLKSIDSVCVTYICRFSSLSDRFIERMLALTTGVLNPKSSEEEIQQLTDFMVNKLTNKDRDKKQTISILTIKKDDGKEIEEVETYTESRLNDRIDWAYIARFQALSNDFIMKFADYLDYKNLSANEKVDHNFVVGYAPNLKGYSQKLSEKSDESEDDLDSVGDI